MLSLNDTKVAIIGLGYVGLPLALAISKKYPVIGFDINAKRVDDLKAGNDHTKEVSSKELQASKSIFFTNTVEEIKDCNVYIITVPTPIDINNNPDLTPLKQASETVGKVISKGDVVIYESTVYPGATEEDCIPVVEDVSGLVFNKDFYAGYSPERINPGDKERPVTKIKKVTSGSTKECADFVDDLYSSVIEAGTFKASSIKVAEASKIIENTQRDVNIALVNELSIIFSKLGLDTTDVIEAAATKWNFIKLQPGLVGGHCIGVDPYYLLHKSVSKGFIPDIIRSAREINDGMARNMVTRLVKKMIQKESNVRNAKVLILGYTFKENCPDIRNTKVQQFIEELKSYDMVPVVYDPCVYSEDICRIKGVEFLSKMPDEAFYDAVVLAVAHDEFKEYGAEKLSSLCKNEGVFFDMKSCFPKSSSDLRL